MVVKTLLSVHTSSDSILIIQSKARISDFQQIPEDQPESFFRITVPFANTWYRDMNPTLQKAQRPLA